MESLGRVYNSNLNKIEMLFSNVWERLEKSTVFHTRSPNHKIFEQRSHGSYSLPMTWSLYPSELLIPAYSLEDCNGAKGLSSQYDQDKDHDLKPRCPKRFW